MNCASIYNTYTCSNPGGTNCNKVGVQIPIVYTATTCASTELVMLTGTDYTKLTAASSTPASTTSTGSFIPASYGITPAAVGYVFAWGAASVLTLWLLGYAIGAVTGAIRRV